MRLASPATTPVRRVLAAFAAIVPLLTFATVASAVPLTGTLNIPGAYPTLAAAVTDLNAQGVGAGGVTLNLVAGNPQTAPGGGYVVGGAGSLVLTSSSAANPVVIQGNGNTITAPTPQTVGVLTDAIFKLIGADWVTITGFTMSENPANVVNTPAASNNMTEFGVALFYVTTTDGAQNNTIQGNTITLNRAYLNTFGVYSNTRHSSTSISVSAEVTAASGSNSNNKVYGNVISSVNYGIVFVGAGTTIAAIDNGNDIGGNSAATGNTITNWGGGAALSSYVSLTGNNYCIFDNQQINDNVSFNTIVSAPLAIAVTVGGILKNYSIGQPTGTFTSTINNNVVTVTNNPSAAAAGSVIGINNQGIAPLQAGATMSISNNTVQNCTLGGAISTTNSLTGITNISAAGTVSMNGNTVVGHAITATSATTAVLNAMSNGGAAGTVNMNNNVVRSLSSTAVAGQAQGITNSGVVVTVLNINNNQLGNASSGLFTSNVASSGTLFAVSSGSIGAGCALSIQNNDIRGIVYNVLASALQLFLQSVGTPLSQNISGNTFTSLNLNTSGGVTFIASAPNLTATGSMAINNNSVVGGLTKASGGTVTFFTSNATSVNGSTVSISGNNISNLALSGTTAFTGINNTDGASASSGPVKTITNNTFNSIGTATGTINPMTVNFSGPGTVVSGNTISNITWGSAITALTLGSSNQATITVAQNVIDPIVCSAAAAVTGISTAAPTIVLSKNKLYDLSGTNAGSTVNGILITAGTAVTASNNLIGNLSASSASGADVVRGISSTSVSTASTINLFYNTIYLNATSGGANFGSSGVFHTASATGTTAALNMRNNIVVNNSTPNGTGVTAAFRRSATTLANYATSSNNNLLYAGSPSASRLLYFDGTNSDQLLATYKTRVNPADQATVTENPPFLSLTGSDPTFLHINPAIANQVESGAAPIGVTDDVDGDLRNGTTPDIGADEFTSFTLAVSAGAGGTVAYTPVRAQYTPGAQVTITPTPDSCFVFDHWSGDASGNANPLVVTMDGNKNIVANFVPANYTIVASAGAGGSISPLGNVAVACGASQKFDVLADSCYAIADVLVDGVSVGPVASYTFPNVHGNHTIAASFTATNYVIAASAGAGGSISPLGNVNVACGASQKFDVTPDSCYAIADVLVDGVSVGPVASYTFAAVSGNHTIAASFSPTNYVIAASAGAGGSISPNGNVNVACGADQKFDVVADACYAIADVLVDGVSVGPVASYTFAAVSGNHTIAASFSATNYVIAASAGAGGSISPNGNVNVACGADQKFDVIADACYAIADVLVDGVSVGPVASYTFPAVGGNHTIAASFVATNYTIVASAGGGGSISPNGNVSVACGADQKFDVTPNDCYQIADVLVDGVSVGPVASYTFAAVSGGHTISASFAPTTYVITASAGPGGSISPSGNVTVACGGDQKFDILPDPCYQIASVLVDGVSVGTVASYRFGRVRGNHTISATFAPANFFILASATGGGSISPSGNVSVACGADQKFDITPNACFHITDVKVDGVSVGPVASYTFTNVQGGHKIQALFAINLYTIVASAGPGGSINPSGTDTGVKCGENRNYTITPNACFHITDVVVDGVSVGPVANYQFTNVQANHTISATFAPTTYVIAASAGPGGTINPSGSVTVNCGTDQKFDIQPDPCQHIEDVIVDGVSVGPTFSYTFTNVQGPHTIHATFGQTTFVVVASAGPGGSISPSGNVVVICGADQKFDIIADPCFHIADVVLDGNSLGPQTSVTIQSVQSAHTISATFAPTTYTIVASAGAGGSISPSGNVVVGCGADQKFDITPDACYAIADVVVDGVSVGTPASYTFTAVGANHTISATFAPTTYVITASASPHGSISPNGAVNVACGADQKFDMTPDPGYDIVQVLVDGNPVGLGTSYTFTNVQGDHTIHVTFLDTQRPACEVVGPNGGETFIIGAPAKLSWSASDGAGVACVDLYLSRNGFGGPWETIAVCIPNSGTYTWVVTGPQTNNAVLQIRVQDQAGNECVDMSAAPFNIIDFTTPAMISEIGAAPSDEGIALTFQLFTPELFASLQFERAEASDGPWTTLDLVPLVTDQAVRIVDHSAAMAHAYWYRLMATTRSGQTVSLGTATSIIPIASFALSPATPNPTRNTAHVFLSLPQAGRVSLAIYDIRGREVTSLAQGEMPAGRHEFTWNAAGANGRVTPGVYFLRATFGKETATQRVVVAR